MEQRDLYWLSGLLEGEGSFMKGPPSSPNLPVVQINMVDEDIIKKVADLFGVKYHKRNPSQQHHNISYVTSIKGKKAVKLMQKIRYLMGIRRKRQIDNALSCYAVYERRLNEHEVRKIKIELLTTKRQADVAEKFGLRRETINRINTGRVWSHVII